jgi:hypothetical protein
MGEENNDGLQVPVIADTEAKEVSDINPSGESGEDGATASEDESTVSGETAEEGGVDGSENVVE